MSVLNPKGHSVSDVDLTDYVKLPGVYTFATLPPQPAGRAGVIAVTTDQGICAFNGTSWVAAAGGGSGTVTSTSVVSANGFTGSVATATTTPAITIGTNVSGPLKGASGALAAAAATDVIGLFSGTGSSSNYLRGDGTLAAPSGAGTVTSASVVSANGLAGSVATATTTPAITLSTTVSGPLKGASGALAAAAASDVIGLFSGTADSNHLLSGAGTLVTGTSIPSLTSYAALVAGDLLIVYSQANAQAEQSTLSVVNAALQAIGLRIQTAATATSITPTVGTADQVNQANTQAAGTLTVNNPTGTPTDGQRLTLRITATNAQTLAFGTAYHAGTTALPTTVAAGTHSYIGFIYDAATSQWDYVSAAPGF